MKSLDLLLSDNPYIVAEAFGNGDVIRVSFVSLVIEVH